MELEGIATDFTGRVEAGSAADLWMPFWPCKWTLPRTLGPELRVEVDGEANDYGVLTPGAFPIRPSSDISLFAAVGAARASLQIFGRPIEIRSCSA